MFTLGQLTQGAPVERRGGQLCVCVRGNVSASVTHTCLCDCLYLCMCVCVCVTSGVREIIASEPGGECRQAITHGRGVGAS